MDIILTSLLSTVAETFSMTLDQITFFVLQMKNKISLAHQNPPVNLIDSAILAFESALAACLLESFPSSHITQSLARNKMEVTSKYDDSFLDFGSEHRTEVMTSHSVQ